MIYPEDDEQTFGQNHYTVNYPFSIENLKTKSPTLPLHFDRRYLPCIPTHTQRISAKNNSSE